MSEIGPSAYDAVAATYESHRELPVGVAGTIRPSVWAAASIPEAARVLDLGAGTGRVGRAFAASGDQYVGVDVSRGMLDEFAGALRRESLPVRLVQAAGERLPFADGTFDVALLIQVVSGERGGRRLLQDAIRVLRTSGVLVVGRTVKPLDGVDARMKKRLHEILTEMGVEPDQSPKRRAGAVSWLESVSATQARVTAASWLSQRTPQAFLDRHITGHNFSRMPTAVQEQAQTALRAWGTDTFGALDAEFEERYVLELQIFGFSPDIEPA